MKMMRALAVFVVLAALAAGAAVVPGCSDDDNLGDSCRSDKECDGRCAEGKDFPDGLCTYACDRELDCPDGWTCADRQGGVCLKLCGSSGACREDFGAEWTCRDVGLHNSGQKDRVCIGD